MGVCIHHKTGIQSYIYAHIPSIPSQWNIWGKRVGHAIWAFGKALGRTFWWHWLKRAKVDKYIQGNERKELEKKGICSSRKEVEIIHLQFLHVSLSLCFCLCLFISVSLSPCLCLSGSALSLAVSLSFYLSTSIYPSLYIFPFCLVGILFFFLDLFQYICLSLISLFVSLHLVSVT